jgi:hypothetical protein
VCTILTNLVSKVFQLCSCFNQTFSVIFYLEKHLDLIGLPFIFSNDDSNIFDSCYVN